MKTITTYYSPKDRAKNLTSRASESILRAILFIAVCVILTIAISVEVVKNGFKKFGLWVWKACGGGRGDGPRVSWSTTPYLPTISHQHSHQPEPQVNNISGTMKAMQLLLIMVLLSSCSVSRWQKSTSDTHFGTAHVTNLIDSTWLQHISQASGVVTTIQYQAVVLPDGTVERDTAYHANITITKYDHQQRDSLATATQSHTEITDTTTMATTSSVEKSVQRSPNLQSVTKPLLHLAWSCLIIYLLFQIIRFYFRNRSSSTQ